MSKKWIGIVLTGSLVLGACSTGNPTPPTPKDTTKPTVNLVLAAGTEVAGQQLVIVDAADTSGIAEVQLKKNGTVIATQKNAPYAFEWDITEAAGTEVTLTAVAKDKAGNVADSSVTVKVVPSQIADPGTNNTSETAAVLKPGQKAVGATTGGADEAWYKFEVDGSTNPNKFVVTPVSPAGSKLDLVLTLYEQRTVNGTPKLVEVGSSDSGGAGGYDPPIAYTAKIKTTYFAKVSGFDGSSGNYTLALDVYGQVGDLTGTVVPMTIDPTTRDFQAEGQPLSKQDVIQRGREVRYMPGRVLAILNSTPISNRKPGIELSETQRQTFETKARALAAEYGLEVAQVPSAEFGYVVLQGRQADVSKTLQSMSVDSRIKYASPDYFRYEDSTPQTKVEPVANGNVLSTYTGRFPNDPSFNEQWGLKLINAPQAWTATTGNMKTVVAVLDSGIAGKIGDTEMNRIPDLAPNLIPGYDFISGSTLEEAEIEVDPDLLERFPMLQYMDRDSNRGPDPYPIQEIDTNKEHTAISASNGHGTHVAGTIGAVGNNRMGVTGVAWDVRIQPIRVLTSGAGGLESDIINGALYAAGYKVTYKNAEGKNVTVQNPTPAKIINMSLGGGAPSDVERTVFEAISNEANVLVIAAAGNESSGDASYPASYSSVMSISSVDVILDSDGDPTNGYQTRPAFSADFSNYGPDVDLAGPGGTCWYTAKNYRDYEEGDFPGKSGLCWRGGDLEGKYNYASIYVLSTYLRNNYPATGVVDASTTYTVDPTYSFSAGTSMATPHVAGVAALMYSINPNLTAYQARQMLRQTAQRVTDADLKGTTPFAFFQGNGKPNDRRDDFYGFGLVDAAAAVEAVLGNKLPASLPANAQAYAVLMAGNDIRDYQKISKEQFAVKFSNLPRGEYKLVFALDNDNDRILAEAGEWIYTATVTVKAGEVVQSSGTLTLADGKNPITLPAPADK